jgi:hypothetical protein
VTFWCSSAYVIMYVCMYVLVIHMCSFCVRSCSPKIGFAGPSWICDTCTKMHNLACVQVTLSPCVSLKCACRRVDVLLYCGARMHVSARVWLCIVCVTNMITSLYTRRERIHENTSLYVWTMPITNQRSNRHRSCASYLHNDMCSSICTWMILCVSWARTCLGFAGDFLALLKKAFDLLALLPCVSQPSSHHGIWEHTHDYNFTPNRLSYGNDNE